MLEALAESGQAGSIDLRSLPLSDADRAQLEELLGRGEVQAKLDLAGASEVWETTYPGVWWIRHKGAGGQDRVRGNRGLPDTRNSDDPSCRYRSGRSPAGKTKRNSGRQDPCLTRKPWVRC